MVTVAEMYKRTKTLSTPLLSNYSGDFWASYISNYTQYDRVFNRMYKSFDYFLQEDDASVEDVTTEFIDEVKALLLANSKKYSELYRIYVIRSDYSILDNYDLNETYSKTGSNTSTNQQGARTDTNVETDTYGARTDTNATTDSLGATNSTTSNSSNAFTDTVTASIGAQTNTTTDGVSAYDKTTFSNATTSEQDIGSKTDTTTTNAGAKSDSSTTSTDAISNSSSTNYVKGAQTDGKDTAFSKGAQTDNSQGQYEEEYTLHRVGNIGVQTPADMLMKHRDFWTEYEFYTAIFKDICAELLEV